MLNGMRRIGLSHRFALSEISLCVCVCGCVDVVCETDRDKDIREK